MYLIIVASWTMIFETEHLKKLSEVGFEPTPPVGDQKPQIRGR